MYSQGNEMDIKQHFRGSISSSELMGVAAAAAYACFAATDATDAALRTIEPIPNPLLDITGEKGPESCWLWSDIVLPDLAFHSLWYTIHFIESIIWL